MTVDFLGVDPNGMNARGGVGGIGTNRSFHGAQQSLDSFHSGWRRKGGQSQSIS